MNRVLAAAFLGLVGLALPASLYAQSPAETTQALAGQQRQIDRLQAILIEQTSIPNPGLKVFADAPQVNANAVSVPGWGFECSTGVAGTVEVAIDGVVVPGTVVMRIPRADVLAVAAGICGGQGTAPFYSGVWALVDLTNYADGAHTASLRIRNAAGLTSKSNVQPFTIVR